MIQRWITPHMWAVLPWILSPFVQCESDMLEKNKHRQKQFVASDFIRYDDSVLEELLWPTHYEKTSCTQCCVAHPVLRSSPMLHVRYLITPAKLLNGVAISYEMYISQYIFSGRWRVESPTYPFNHSIFRHTSQRVQDDARENACSNTWESSWTCTKLWKLCTSCYGVVSANTSPKEVRVMAKKILTFCRDCSEKPFMCLACFNTRNQ